MTPEELLRKVKALEWTQEVRSSHPWHNDTLIRRSDVEALIRNAGVSRLVDWKGD